MNDSPFSRKSWNSPRVYSVPLAFYKAFILSRVCLNAIVFLKCFKSFCYVTCKTNSPKSSTVVFQQDKISWTHIHEILSRLLGICIFRFCSLIFNVQASKRKKKSFQRLVGLFGFFHRFDINTTQPFILIVLASSREARYVLSVSPYRKTHVGTAERSVFPARIERLRYFELHGDRCERETKNPRPLTLSLKQIPLQLRRQEYFFQRLIYQFIVR